MRRQVSRKADQTIVYELFSKGKFVRRTVNGASFLMQVRSAGETASASRVASYCIDVTKDYYGLGKPVDFNQVMKGADGAVVSDVNTSVSFDGAVNVELGGCAYALTKIIELSRGSVRGKAGSNRAEIWYSRDLKTSLYSRSEDGERSIIEFRARDISTSFTPVGLARTSLGGDGNDAVGACRAWFNSSPSEARRERLASVKGTR
jgi:hypothetical protein